MSNPVLLAINSLSLGKWSVGQLSFSPIISERMLSIWKFKNSTPPIFEKMKGSLLNECEATTGNWWLFKSEWNMQWQNGELQYLTKQDGALTMNCTVTFNSLKKVPLMKVKLTIETENLCANFITCVRLDIGKNSKKKEKGISWPYEFRSVFVNS
jgi:hypothetical protein